MSIFGAVDCCDDGDAGDDVLSLCDMPLYGDAADYSFSSEDASSFGDELFEFSPRDDKGDASSPGPSPVLDSCDVVFCGKVVPMLPPSNPYVGERMDQTVKKKKTGVVKKARVMSYSSARCDKWYMLAFGLARFPSEMVMSEIRRRQGKGKGNPGGGRTTVKDLGCSRREEAVAGGEVVKASYGCFPRL